MPSGPYPTDEALQQALETETPFNQSGTLTYAIIDKTRPASAEDDVDDQGQLAGMVSYMNSHAANRTTEIGCVVILPAFQRTHVTSNVVGLLLRHAFRARDDSADSGLGMVRVVWQTSSVNAASLRVAERFAFRHEGVLRWHRLFPDGRRNGKLGNGEAVMPPGTGVHDLWRHTVVLALCWDDWVGGADRTAVALMDRVN
jgi:RimJ/RimL family protein N-acetyltransferase